MPNPIQLFERRAIVVKIETTYGTDAAPAGATDSVQTFEGSVQFEADQLSRNQDRSFFGANPFTLINKRGMVEFDIEMVGAATVGNAAPIGPVLRSCGHAEALTPATSAAYTPVSTGFASATVYFEHAGLTFKLTGCRGSIDWELTIDGYAKGRVRYMGLIVAASPEEAAIAGVTIAGFQPPPAIEVDTWTVTVGGVPLNAVSLTLSQNATTQLYHGSESREVSYRDRESNGRLIIFQEALATFNPWQLANTHADQAIVCTVDGGAGLITQLNIARAQLQYPQLADRDGAMTWDIPFVAKPINGNDEYGWTFS